MDAEPLRLDSIAKTLGGRVQALRKIDFAPPPGRITGLLGPNGAGKTTSLLIAVGLVRADSGGARLFGLSPSSTEVRRRVTMLPERFEPYPFLTPRELLAMQADLYRVTADGSLLEKFGLASVRRPIRTLSKGMNQRVGLACAVLPRPELLILDEPSSGLDPEGRDLLIEVLRDERRRGCTVVLSTHILADVERICDDVVIVREGRTVASFAIADLPPKSGEGGRSPLEQAYMNLAEKA